MCLGVLPACVSGHHVYAWCPQRLEEGVRSPGLYLQEVVGARNWTWGPLEEQPMLLATESPLQLPLKIFLKNHTYLSVRLCVVHVCPTEHIVIRGLILINFWS